MFQPWHIWVIIALVCFVVEIFTNGFAIACFSFGGVAAAILAACGVGLKIQLIVFAAVSFLVFLFVRPLVIKIFLKNGKEEVKTGVDALIGRIARVSEDIDPDKGTGRVAVDGDDWKAVSEDEQPIEKGSKVEILKVSSVILTVKKI